MAFKVISLDWYTRPAENNQVGDSHLLVADQEVGAQTPCGVQRGDMDFWDGEMVATGGLEPPTSAL